MNGKVEYIELLTKELGITDFQADDFLNSFENFYENIHGRELEDDLDFRDLNDFVVFQTALENGKVDYSISLDLRDLLFKTFVGDKLVETEFFESFEELTDFLYVSDYESMLDYSDVVAEEIERQANL
ncbi:MAG: hypothetical protein E7G36_00350 [Peptoniphilus rhinitidis]|uniref:hypothetical protein n=1 Tax=Peptoniphilus rhinitidis TaxID=1175452 RepID=UPI0029051E8F|nr:hypothetical protein [Peptoniphilus rhinitidis]MDU2108995.1 hypothetical protein [Peptoniphilus lacydonensis]MDU3750154.1 hypothetical protein [Peptoniphilus rhinitidis]